VVDLERDLKIVSLMAGDLKAYLLSNRLYWPLSETGPVSHPFPMGTLGGLFLRLRFLEFSEQGISINQQQQLTTVRARVHEKLSEWVVQADEKAVREIGARLQTWAAYLQDLAEHPHNHITEYPTQVEGRVIIALLLEFVARAAEGQQFSSQLDALDRQLHQQVADAPFVWDASLAAAFPRDPFWWLYVSPHL
jgi:hypothetical protein